MDWNKIKVIAIVGASAKPERDSNKVMKYFLLKGFIVIPINPTYDSVLGQKCYPSLSDIPVEIAKTIDMVDIFRKSDEVLPIVQEAIRLKKKHGNLKMVWMQLGIINSEAAALAKKEGLDVVMNTCAMVNHNSVIR